MALSYFFVESLEEKNIQLDEDTSKHVISVLRMQKDESLLLTDGKGHKAEARIIDDNRNRCVVEVVTKETEVKREPSISIAISITKTFKKTSIA